MRILIILEGTSILFQKCILHLLTWYSINSIFDHIHDMPHTPKFKIMPWLELAYISSWCPMLLSIMTSWLGAALLFSGFTRPHLIGIFSSFWSKQKYTLHLQPNSFSPFISDSTSLHKLMTEPTTEIQRELNFQT